MSCAMQPACLQVCISLSCRLSSPFDRHEKPVTPFGLAGEEKEGEGGYYLIRSGANLSPESHSLWLWIAIRKGIMHELSQNFRSRIRPASHHPELSRLSCRSADTFFNLAEMIGRTSSQMGEHNFRAEVRLTMSSSLRERHSWLVLFFCRFWFSFCMSFITR